MGGRIILTADAHNADKVIWGYEDAAALARAAGFEKASVLTCSGEKECRI